MRKLNNNKLQALRNFQSIWHNNTVSLSNTLKEDNYIRKYIIGTMKAKGWKISEIIIKRKVNNIHIIYQVNKSKKKIRKIWTKNRLKNRIKYEEKHRLESRILLLKRKRMRDKMNKELSKNIYINPQSFSYKEDLSYLSFLIITQLKKIFKDNEITLYIQKSKPFYLNNNLVKCWIEDNIKKKKSYKRLIKKIIRKYKKIVSQYSFSSYLFKWNQLKNEERDKFISWFSTNLIYLFNINFNNHQLLNVEPSFTSLPYSFKSVFKHKKPSPFIRYSQRFYYLKSRFSHLFYKFKMLDKKSGNNILSNKSQLYKNKRYLKKRVLKKKTILSHNLKYVISPLTYKK